MDFDIDLKAIGRNPARVLENVLKKDHKDKPSMISWDQLTTNLNRFGIGQSSIQRLAYLKGMLLMEEIPHHLRCIKHDKRPVSNGINYHIDWLAPSINSNSKRMGPSWHFAAQIDPNKFASVSVVQRREDGHSVTLAQFTKLAFKL